jgi:hypothetical protein
VGNIETTSKLPSLKWTTKHATDEANATATSGSRGSITFVFVQRNRREWRWNFAACSILDKLFMLDLALSSTYSVAMGSKYKLSGMEQRLAEADEEGLNNL